MQKKVIYDGSNMRVSKWQFSFLNVKYGSVTIIKGSDVLYIY